MPQAPTELRNKFPGGEGEACDVLRANYTFTNFVIRPKDRGHIPTLREIDAIDYLFQEWDWGYEVPVEGDANDT